MPISTSYPKGVPIEDADLFVGTKANNNRTVNYTASGIADYLNINSRIAIGGQMSFKFVISPNVPGTISFEGGGGNNTPFSTITKLIVSAIDVSSSNITIFLNYLTNSDILLSQQNEPNYFGHYKITGYTQIDTTEFYQLDLSYIGGNGNIEQNLYYDIVSFVITSGSSTPTLEEVLTEGNTSTGIDIELTYDPIGGGGQFTAIDDTRLLQATHLYDGFRVTNNSFFTEYLNGVIRLDGGSSTSTTLYFTAPTGSGTIIIPDVLNSTETFALLSDIPSIVTPTLDEVLAVGSVASMVLTDGSTYSVSMPFDDTLDLYAEDRITDASADNFLYRQMVLNRIQNSVNNVVGSDFYVNENYLEAMSQIEGDTNRTNLLYTNVGGVASQTVINIPTPKIGANVEINHPYKEVTGAYTLATLDDIPTNTSDLINDGEDGVHPYITLLDLPSNLILYPTTVASDVVGYVKLVTDIHDPEYNVTAVDVSTGSITTTNQLVASLITVPDLISGNPGVFNISTVGNIRRSAGSGTAEFYFNVYKRDSLGTETLIGVSNPTLPVNNGVYAEFNATAIWDDGVFTATDRIVLKFYGSRIAGGSNPTYEFQFGGTTPVRTLVPIPLSVVPSIPNATETVAGIAEIATTAEVTTGTDDTRIITPLKLKEVTDLKEDVANKENTTLDNSATKYPTNNLVKTYVTRDFNFDNLITNQLSYFFPTVGVATFPNIMRTGNITLSGNTLNNGENKILFSTTAIAGTLAFQRGVSLVTTFGTSTFVNTTMRFQINSNVSSTRFFFGYTRSYALAAPTNVDLTTLINCIGVCKIDSSENLHFIHNDASGLATLIDCGINFPANSLISYEYTLNILKEKNSANKTITLTRSDGIIGNEISTSTVVNESNFTPITMYTCSFITNNTTASIASFFHKGVILTQN